MVGNAGGRIYPFTALITGSGTLTLSTFAANTSIVFDNGAMNYDGDVVLATAQAMLPAILRINSDFHARSLSINDYWILQVTQGNLLGLEHLTINTLPNVGATVSTPLAMPDTRLEMNRGLLRFQVAGSVVGSLSGTGTDAAISGANNASVAFHQTFDGTYAGRFTDASATDPTVWSKSGPATLSLTGQSVVAGPVVINEGTLRFGDGNTNGGLDAPEIQVDGTLEFARTDTATYLARFAGSGTLRHTGSGHTSLAGGGTFAGDVLVEQGVLAVDGAMAGARVHVTGGALAGVGSIGPTTIAAAATVEPGSSIGTLSFQSLVLEGVYHAEYSPAVKLADILRVGGLLTLDPNSSTLRLDDRGQPGTLDGAPLVLVEYGSLEGRFAHALNLPAGYRLAYGETGNTIALVQIPEPATAILSGMSFACLSRRRRR